MAAYVLAGRGTLSGSVTEQYNCGIPLSQRLKVVG